MNIRSREAVAVITSSAFAVLHACSYNWWSRLRKSAKRKSGVWALLKKIISTNNFGSYSNTFYMFVPNFALVSGITTKEHCAEGRHPYRLVFCVISQVGA